MTPTDPRTRSRRRLWAVVAMAVVSAAGLVLRPVEPPEAGLWVGGLSSAFMAPMWRPLDDAASPEARRLADWVAQAGDHADAPFVVVDKKRAQVFVFDARARLRAHSAVRLGAVPGDHSVPGIGTRPMARVRPFERATPAGRFVAEIGRHALGEELVWVDCDAASSMHRVRTDKPAERVERRAERLASPTSEDNRISSGCINVPVDFFESHIQPSPCRARGGLPPAVDMAFGQADG